MVPLAPPAVVGPLVESPLCEAPRGEDETAEGERGSRAERARQLYRCSAGELNPMMYSEDGVRELDRQECLRLLATATQRSG